MTLCDGCQEPIHDPSPDFDLCIFCFEEREIEATSRLLLTMAWPRFPEITPTGKLSLSKNAGKLVPWLSINRVATMGYRQHRDLVERWQAAAAEAWRGKKYEGNYPVRMDVILHRRQAYNMDVTAVVEGMKPLVDAMVKLGLIPEDKPQFVAGIDGRAEKTTDMNFITVLIAPAQNHESPKG